MTQCTPEGAVAAAAAAPPPEPADPRAAPHQRTSPPALLAAVLAALVPLLVVRVKLHGIDDPDALWHILSGSQVWGERAVVTDDVFGHLGPNAYVHIDWLADLSMAATDHVAGLVGVAWMFVALDIVLYLTIYLVCRTRADALVAAIVSVLALVGTFGSLGERPQTFSFILIAIFVHVWLRVADDGSRTPWWLVPVTYVWACLHGQWLLGPLIGLVVVAGMALDRAVPRRRLGVLALVPAASVAAAALTPVGPRLLESASTVSGYSDLVSEWATPNIHQPNVAAAVVLLAVCALAFALSRARVPWVHVLLWGMALGWTLLYARTVAVGSIIAAPLVAGALGALLKGTDASLGRRRDMRLVVLGGALAVVLAAALAPSAASELRGMPTALSPALDRLPAGTVVLDDDHAGGWLLYAHPGLRPVIDTRQYLFPRQFIVDYIEARQAQEGWQSFVERTGATAALLPPTDPLAGRLVSDRGWTQVAGDGQFVLLVAPGAPS